MTRQIVLDTETTGLEVNQGHRVIEIGCVEMTHRRPSGNNFHHYVNPERAIDYGAAQVHGITSEFLADKPRFTDIAASFLDYVRGAELLIHNAEFDVGFLDKELERAGRKERMADLCRITDTVAMARKLRPGQKNNLDALCKHYGVDNSHRDLHGALLDARLLADVYLAMTAGQSTLLLDAGAADKAGAGSSGIVLQDMGQGPITVIRAEAAELEAHRARLAAIQKKAGKLLWSGELEPPAA